jgi:hypothetical protein
MSLASTISALFSAPEPFRPQLQFKAGHAQRYRIEMENRYFTLRGERVKSQTLATDFTRVIKEVPSPALAFTESRLGPVHFSEQGRPPMRWTFADGVRLPHHLLRAESLEDLKRTTQVSTLDDLFARSQRFGEAFAHLPKLPAVYLLIMQALDIVTMDEFASHICSSPRLFSSTGKELQLESLSSSQSQLGFGMYGDSSNFKNGEFYATFLGYGFAGGRACVVCEYRCDATLSMTDEGAGLARTRQGKSYYSGSLHLDIATGLPVLGTMMEYVFSGQSVGGDPRRMAAPQSVCRKVRLELVGEGPEEGNG